MADHTMSLRISDYQYERLREEAYKQRRTYADIVRSAIDLQFDKWDRIEEIEQVFE